VIVSNAHIILYQGGAGFMRHIFAVMGFIWSCGVCAATSPQLLTHIAMQGSFVQGTERLYPVQLRQDAAREAVADGGMWLTTPSGESTFAKTVRMDIQRDGNQTWIGKVSTPGGERSVVITFGRNATFGALLSATGTSTRLLTQNGKTYLAQTDERAAAAHAQAMKLLPLPTPDYLMPPRTPASARMLSQANAAVAAAAAGTRPPIVDVLIGYTPGMVSALGSNSAVVTRINYLVSLTNQAFADSQVNGRVRLVGTLEVSYPDNTTNDQALYDLSNNSSSTVAGSLALAPLRARRQDLGADLVSLLRPFSSTTQGGSCGVGWLNGGNLTPYTTASAASGYSDVSDGQDGSGYGCADISTAHELGHNLGLAHDKGNSTGPGAFTYAYGWEQTLPSGSFATLMAYPATGQQLLAYYADPNITLCNNHPCGDPVEANQTLALNQTMPVAAEFNAPGGPKLDLDGDGAADLLIQNDAGGQFTYMLEGFGFFPSSSKTMPVTAGYHIAAVGDLQGDHVSELIWTSAANDLYFWTYNGAGGFTSVQGPSYGAGWKLVGTGDINGDGTSDLLWINASTHQFSYWLMNGSTVIGTKIISIAPGYSIAAIGDLAGKGHVDLVWTSAAHDLYLWMNNGNGGFTSVRGLDYPAGWQLVGSGDIDGDQRADLIWTNDATHQFAYWLMNGSTRVGYKISSIASGYHIVNIDRVSGAVASILWSSAANDLYLWQGNGDGSFTSSHVVSNPAAGGGYYYNYPSGWSVVSTLPANP